MDPLYVSSVKRPLPSSGTVFEKSLTPAAASRTAPARTSAKIRMILIRVLLPESSPPFQRREFLGRPPGTLSLRIAGFRPADDVSAALSPSRRRRRASHAGGCAPGHERSARRRGQ